MNEIAELKRQGLSIQAISNMTGFDRKTVRRYLRKPDMIPVYGPRPKPPSILDAHKPYLEERMKAGVWNAQVLLRELRERGYKGGYTLLTDWLRPQRKAAGVVAVRRFETSAGQQAQVDWGHLGDIVSEGRQHKLWCFTFTLGHSRMMMASIALEQKLGTLLRMHEAAFEQLGGVPKEILYDRMRTVWQDVNDRGEIVWNPVFQDFARHWGFTPRLCRPYRAQTKGKVESGVKYVRRNFACGLLGREPANLADLNAELRNWVWTVANQRVHGTTQERVITRWPTEQAALLPANKTPYAYADEDLRKVARDAFVHWQGNRYCVPWQYAGLPVWVRPQENGTIAVHHGAEKIAHHVAAEGKHQVIKQADHHAGIPFASSSSPEGKTLLHLRERAPSVEVRPLSAYENFAVGGGL